jgi:hypothetical protein
MNGGGGSHSVSFLRREIENTLLSGKITDNFGWFGWAEDEARGKSALFPGFKYRIIVIP